MADLEISNLPPIAGSLLQATDPLPLADLSASETKRITVKDLIQSGVALIDPGSIPPDKLNFALQPDTVGTVHIQAKAVTAAKLGDNSSVVLGAALPAVGSYIGQLGLTTAGNKLSIWNGSAWEAFKAAGSVNVVQGATFGPLTTAVSQVGDTATVTAKVTDATAAAQFLAGPAAGGGSVTLRGITPDDLPRASGSVVGAVSVPLGGGLRIDGGATGLGAQLNIDNTVVSSSTAHLVTYDRHGLVTGGRPLASADLPAASVGGKGAIIPGTEFTVQTTGELRHTNQITPGTGIKLSYDAQGHITGAASLQSSDIPSLDASKITSGSLSSAVLGNKSITRDKLADYAIAFIQEAIPPTAGVPIGELWYQESTAGLHMWNGNSWMPISVGRLSQENLRYCGLISAATGLITGVTSFGTAAAYKIGDALRTATDADTGVYFVVETAGNGIGTTAGITYDPGDWVLCSGQVAGWHRIDTLSSGGGGGGGAARLNDLLDVTLTTPSVGQILVYNSSGQWVNTDVLSGGTY